jgi:hypothetical protein
MIMSSLQLEDLSDRDEEEKAHTVLVTSKLGHSIPLSPVSRDSQVLLLTQSEERLRLQIRSVPFLLTCILGVELPVAPLGPLRKCPPLVVLHISILTAISHPPLCGRNQALSMVFEAELEARH